GNSQVTITVKAAIKSVKTRPPFRITLGHVPGFADHRTPMLKTHDNPPEDRLCLLLARGRLTPDEQFRTRELLSSPINWPQVLEQVYAHGVYPLVYSNLRELGFSGVPDAIRTELKRAHLANTVRNQLLSQELAHLLRQLSDAGIPTIPLKGVFLAESFYGDPA